ncbi:unnamed protein product [Spirodela intermedia]|uniref:FCP1 homology domain-containing protein n=1 Tax=Spirodela intermedia TaxID=51605 RepID=A0A7I8J5Y7_SPIIN|nr:unnamed protein product [Spirodela intermedia]CAA6665658.1 unnamed protein product [Spirodela intermedia]
MVSQRIVKRTPTKKTLKQSPTSRFHGRRSRSSPLKDIASVPTLVAASIDRSIRSCRRRLIKVFTRLKKRRKKQGFVLLNAAAFPPAEGGEDGPAPPPPPQLQIRRPLPSPACAGRRTLFLDLDETLVHSQTSPPVEKYDFVVRPTVDGQILTFYVVKRPGVEQLLAEAAKHFEIVLFTAGLREYASLVLDRLDPHGEFISHKLYRDSCSEIEGILTKDLSDLGRDLSRVVILDDNPNSYALQPANAVPVAPFLNDLSDRELWRVMEFFAVAGDFEDTRDAVKSFLSTGGKKTEKNPLP